MYLSVGHDWNFSAEERAQAMKVGLAAGVRPGRKWNLREKEPVERAGDGTIQEGNINVSDAPPASTEKQISEPQVT